jgi:hypothetical protein
MIISPCFFFCWKEQFGERTHAPEWTCMWPPTGIVRNTHSFAQQSICITGWGKRASVMASGSGRSDSCRATPISLLPPPPSLYFPLYFSERTPKSKGFISCWKISPLMDPISPRSNPKAKRRIRRPSRTMTN